MTDAMVPSGGSSMIATDPNQYDQALIRAVGLDKVSEPERVLALRIAERYDLDLLLKHLVLIDGRAYITRDGLLWVAHRSSVFDGIEVVVGPEIREFPGLGQCWYTEVVVYRKDMTRSFRYGGRYPVGGRNRVYGPEMSIKVAEVMTLRRAFNVAAPTLEEKWDTDLPPGEPLETPAPQSLSDVVSQRLAQVAQATTPPTEEPVVDGEVVDLPETPPADPDTGEVLTEPMTPEQSSAIAGEPAVSPLSDGPIPMPATPGDTTVGHPLDRGDPGASYLKAVGLVDGDDQGSKPAADGRSIDEQCPATSPFEGGARCRLFTGHKGSHRSGPRESW